MLETREREREIGERKEPYRRPVLRIEEKEVRKQCAAYGIGPSPLVGGRGESKGGREEEVYEGKQQKPMRLPFFGGFT